MGSVVLVSMGARWHLVVGITLTLISTWARVTCLDMPWSTLSLMSSQASKRSAEEAADVEEDMEGAASDTHYDNAPHYSDYTDADTADMPESRGGPLRRRRKYNRLRRRKNRYPQSASEPYDNLVVPSTDFHSNSVDSLSDNQFYDRDSSYQAPSSGYNSPESSYSSPNNYEAPSYYDAPPYKQSYGEPYSGGTGINYRNFGSNSVSKSDSLGQANTLYDYDYYGGDDGEMHDKHDENFLVKLFKYFRGDSISRNDDCYGDYCDYYYDDGYQNNLLGGGGPLEAASSALRTILPLGLLVAALVPSTVTLHRRRKRDAEDIHEEEFNSVETYPFLDKINKIGLKNLQDISCQKELFCEMSVMGDSKEGNFVQKVLATIVQYTPDFLSDTVGVKDVFQASDRRSCEQFKCLKY